MSLLLAGYFPDLAQPVAVQAAEEFKKCRWCLERKPAAAFSRMKLETSGKGGTRFNKYICAECSYARPGVESL